MLQKLTKTHWYIIGASFLAICYLYSSISPVIQQYIGKSKYENQEYVSALEWLELAAYNRKPEAQFLLAEIYNKGLTGKVDYKEAKKWYLISASEGIVESKYNLGLLYFNGSLKNRRNIQKAYRYFLEAANLNYAEAQYMLGNMFSTNKYGLKKNYKKAYRWFRLAADQDHAKAQESLAIMFAIGKGLKIDSNKAKSLAEKSLENGNEDAMLNLGLAYMRLKKGENLAFNIIEKSAKSGYAKSQAMLGKMYLLGIGTQVSSKQAEFWYKKSVEQNEPSGQIGLGELYLANKNYSKAFELFKEAAKKEIYPKAFYNLGLILENGYGVKQNISKAVEYYSKSAKLGDVNSMMNIAKIYYNSEGEIEKAVDWYLKAAEKNNVEAQEKLGFIYLNGEKGFKKDQRKSFLWFKKAAEQGSLKSEFMTAEAYFDGIGIITDYKKAFNLYLKAAMKHYIPAELKISTMYQKGLGVSENKGRAFAWILKAANQGDLEAERLIGGFYKKGIGVAENKSKALEWLYKSATGGNVKAQYDLGLMFEELGSKKGVENAISWYTKAAKAGSSQAQVRLDSLYEIPADGTENLSPEDLFKRGKELIENDRLYNDGVKLLTRAARKNHIKAQEYLGFLYYEGTKVKTNCSKLIYWLDMAVKNGGVSSLPILGDVYLQGMCGKADVVKGYSYIYAAIKSSNGALIRDPQVASLYNDLESNLHPLKIKQGREMAKQYIN